MPHGRGESRLRRDLRVGPGCLASRQFALVLARGENVHGEHDRDSPSHRQQNDHDGYEPEGNRNCSTVMRDIRQANLSQLFTSDRLGRSEAAKSSPQ